MCGRRLHPRARVARSAGTGHRRRYAPARPLRRAAACVGVGTCRRRRAAGALARRTHARARLSRQSSAGHGVARSCVERNGRHPGDARCRARRRGEPSHDRVGGRRDRGRRPNRRGRHRLADIRSASRQNPRAVAAAHRRTRARRARFGTVMTILGSPVDAVHDSRTSARLRPAVLAVRSRSAIALVVVSAVGLLAFGWPFLLSAKATGADSAHTGDAPWVFAAVLPLLLVVVLAELADGGMDAKAIALLAVLTACGAALRPLSIDASGATPVFFLLIPAGRVLGRGFGFVL